MPTPCVPLSSTAPPVPFSKLLTLPVPAKIVSELVFAPGITARAEIARELSWSSSGSHDTDAAVELVVFQTPPSTAPM
jgi:hypothetical protein